MKKLIVVAIFIFSIAFSGCDIPGGGANGGGVRLPSKIVLNNPKALFVSSGSTSSSGISANVVSSGGASMAVSTGEKSFLFQLLEDDTIDEVSFTDESGNEIIVYVNEMVYLNDKYVGLELVVEDVASSQLYNAIIDIDNGIIYDFSNYALSAGEYYSKPAIINGQLYILGEYQDTPNGTLYRVNLSTMDATPMNNSGFLPITRFYHISGGDFLVYNNYDMRIYVLQNGGSAPVEVTGTEYDAINEMNDLSGPSMDAIELIYDINGELYDFDVTYDGYDTVNPFSLNYLSFSTNASGLLVSTEEVDNTITAFGQYNYIILSNNNLYDTSRVMAFENGFVFSEREITGGFSRAFVAKDLSALFGTNVENLVWKGTICFYNNTSTNTIYKWDIAATAAASEFLAESPIANSLSIIGDYLYYSKFIDATTVQTWKVKTDGTGAEKVSDSQMEIKNIIELTI